MIRKHRLLVAYLLILVVFTTYVALDTFVITRVYGGAYAQTSTSTEAAQTSGGSTSEESRLAVTTSNSYEDSNISVTVNGYTVSDTQVYVAEVSLSSPEYLKTALAQGLYGKNVTATTSEIAEDNNAILAINGDYYGTQERGYVIKNGELYRSTAASGQEDLVIYKDGTFKIINESEVSAEDLIADGAVQTLSFGPALVENGQVSVGTNDEVKKAMGSNPRTAIGVRADGTYLFVVADGRTDESEGLSLYELAEFMEEQGAVTAYNLDGGGSSTMVFNGNVINNPTGGMAGHGSGNERSVSDIVYIGY
ncbi:MAG: phosphodiester glycosidase family protein [Clostridiales bacterium]|nr:phosphodiester glycosidase family protein [Clostridiales bacterium]